MGPQNHKTFARTDAPREATYSTSEPISQLDERSALGSKVAIVCCTSRARRAIEKQEGPVSPLQWHRNGVCGTRTLHQLRSFRAHGIPKAISNFVMGSPCTSDRDRARNSPANEVKTEWTVGRATIPVEADPIQPMPHQSLARVELQWKKMLKLISLLSNDGYHKEECPAIA